MRGGGNESLLLRARELLKSMLALGSLTMGQRAFLIDDRLHTPRACVAGSSTRAMLMKAALEISRDACVQALVLTQDNVDKVLSQAGPRVTSRRLLELES